MTLNKILRYAVLGGVFIIPFVPLFVSNSLFFPFITGKNFAFRIIIEIIFGTWVILAILDKEYRPKFSWILGAIGTFLILIGISDLLSPNPYKSFWSNYERMEGFISLLHLFAYFLIAGSVLQTQKLWDKFFNVSVAVSLIEVFYGFFQLAGKIVINQGGVRLDGTFGNASYLAAYMMIHIFISAYLFVRVKGKIGLKWFYAVVAMLQFFTLYYTATRGAFLGLVSGVFVAGVVYVIFRWKENVYAKYVAGAIFSLILIAGGLYLGRTQKFVTNSPTLSRIVSISFEEAKPRLMVWSMALEGFKERPIFGWGQESFNYVFNKYYNPQMYGQESWFDRAHNVFFDWLIAGGILGLLSYLSMFFFFLYYLWKGSVSLSFEEKAILTGLISAYFIQNIFVFDNLITYVLFFTALAFIHNQNAKPIKDFSDYSVKDESFVKSILVPVVFVIVVLIVYFVNVRAMFAGDYLIQALSSQQEGFSKNLEYFKKAINYNSFGDSEITEQLSQVASKMSQYPDSDSKVSIYNLAVEKLLAQIKRAPEDARYELFLGSLLSIYGKYDEALIYSKKALELSPKKQQIFFQIGSTYLSQKKYQEAMKYFKEAYDLAPEFGEAVINYAYGAILSGDNALAQNILIPVFKTALVDDSRIIKAYVQTYQYQKAISILQSRMAKNPTDERSYLDTAYFYVLMGEINRAISTLDKLAVLKPELKEQIASYTAQLRAGIVK